MYYIHTSVCSTIISTCIATLSTTAAINTASTTHDHASGPGFEPWLKARIFPTANNVLLHTEFHYRPPTLMIWLKTVTKDVKSQAIHPRQYNHHVIKRNLSR